MLQRAHIKNILSNKLKAGIFFSLDLVGANKELKVLTWPLNSPRSQSDWMSAEQVRSTEARHRRPQDSKDPLCQCLNGSEKSPIQGCYPDTSHRCSTGSGSRECGGEANPFSSCSFCGVSGRIVLLGGGAWGDELLLHVWVKICELKVHVRAFFCCFLELFTTDSITHELRFIISCQNTVSKIIKQLVKLVFSHNINSTDALDLKSRTTLKKSPKGRSFSNILPSTWPQFHIEKH